MLKGNILDKFQQFWVIVVDVWQNGFLGIDFGRILTAIAIFAFFLLIRRLFTRFVIHRITAITSRTQTTIDDKVLLALKNPIRFVPVVFGAFISLEYLNLEGDYKDLSEQITRSLVVFLIFWIAFRMDEPVRYYLSKIDSVFNETMLSWFIKAMKTVIAFVGFATILELWGIQVGPIIAGLGLFGVAVALGAQDMFKNLISGILIIAEKRFDVGDWVRVDGVVEGTVEIIGFRSTLVRRFDKAPVFVPNAKLSDNAVTNFSAMTSRRIYWMIGLEYRTSVEQLRCIRDRIEGLVTNNPDFVPADQAATFVRIDKFSDSSIDMMLYCFTQTTKWGEWLRIKEQLALAIKSIVEEEKAGFAFPSQSIYLEAVPDDTPEAFMPPQAPKMSSDKK